MGWSPCRGTDMASRSGTVIIYATGDYCFLISILIENAIRKCSNER